MHAGRCSIRHLRHNLGISAKISLPEKGTKFAQIAFGIVWGYRCTRARRLRRGLQLAAQKLHDDFG